MARLSSSGQRLYAVEQIVQAGLCIGCGLCQSVAGPQRVRMIATRTGRERPVALQQLDRATLARINAVCPGLTVEGADRRALAPGAVIDAVWGPTARLAIAHASDPEIRFVGASGGVLTALAERLLRRGEVEFVVHVAPSPPRPLRSVRHLSVERAQLLRGAGSRYGPAAPLIDFCQLLDRGRPFALVGKPCDISAARNLARHDPRVNAQMRYALAMVCGGASELGKSLQVLDALGLDERQLRLFRYRGHGNPGATRIETADGVAHELSYTEMWADERTWQIQARCKICPDALGEGADIVAGDCWEGGSPVGEDEGFNAVLVRTGRGVRLFDDAVADGTVTVVRSITVQELNRFQPHQLAKKRAVWARLVGMRLAGSPAVRTRGLRLRRLALSHPGRSLAEALGAFRRVRSGRLGEPPPEPEGPAAEPSGPHGEQPGPHL
jgi:coenzyme F420 hydrogenase subunit beta